MGKVVGGCPDEAKVNMETLAGARYSAGSAAGSLALYAGLFTVVDEAESVEVESVWCAGDTAGKAF